MDSTALKRFLSEDASRVQKTLEMYHFHHFNLRRDELRCAVPDGDNATSVSVKLNEKLYVTSYTRPVCGDIFDLIRYVTDLPFASIMRQIKELFGIDPGVMTFSPKQYSSDFKQYARYHRQYEEPEIRTYDLDILERYDSSVHMPLVNEGVAPDIYERFKICYDPHSERLIFPHLYWKDPQKIVGLQGRITGMSEQELKILGVPKYLNLINGYKKSRNLYGFTEAIGNIRLNKTMIIFEAEKSVLKEFTFSKGLGTSVALGGHIISEDQLHIIGKTTPVDTEVVFALDKDVYSNGEEFSKLKQSMRKLDKIRKVSYLDEQWVMMTLYDKQSPVDRGLKVWEFLYANRKAYAG